MAWDRMDEWDRRSSTLFLSLSWLPFFSLKCTGHYAGSTTRIPRQTYRFFHVPGGHLALLPGRLVAGFP